MKKIIIKLIGLITSLFAIFLFGKKSGINKVNNELNQQTLNDIQKAKKIKNEIDEKFNNAKNDDDLSKLYDSIMRTTKNKNRK